MPWGNAVDSIARPYLVKARGRTQWTTTTIKGPRRVERWEPWRTVGRFATSKEAAEAVERYKRSHGLTEVGIFLRGKRLYA